MNGKGLEDFLQAMPAVEMPAQDIDRQQELAAQREKRQQDRERAQELKAQMLERMEQGAQPQTILLLAVDAIGLLTNDTGWSQTLAGQIKSVWEENRQESFLFDNAKQAAGKLEETQQKYKSKLVERLQKQLKECATIEAAIKKTLSEIEQ